MEEMTLQEWTLNFVKNKDILSKKLIGFEESEGKINFHFKDKDHTYIITKNLDENVLNNCKDDHFKSIVCDANDSNFKFLLSKWNDFIKAKNFNLIFVNVANNKKWIINPLIHSKICDDESLVLGLKTMYDNIF